MTARDDQFEGFVRSQRAVLVRFAVALTAGDAHLAEDLVQGALVRVYLARPNSRENLHAYVRRAIVNAFIDHKRRPFMRRERARDVLPELAAPADETGVDPALMAALRQLPARMRAAVVLRHVEDLSVEDVARTLGCSAGTVKSQTARGLDKLRNLLEAEGANAHSSGPSTNPEPGAPRANSRITTKRGDQPCPT